MKELEAWLRRRAREDQQVPLVEGALLSGQFSEYAAYRLRLFGLRTLVAAVAHTLRLTLLWAAFSRSAFLQLLLFEAGVGLAISFWWGALEPMRDRIRRLHRQGRTHLVRPEIERWLTVALILAAAVVLACGAWIVWRAGRFGAADLYGVALFVRLALLLITRTYHSGLYALRRIYRPSWAVVAVDIVLLGAVATTWPIAGAWALPVGLILASVVGAGLTIHFTRRMFAFAGLAPRWGAFGALGMRWHVRWYELLGAGVSFAIVKLDAVLVFLLFDPRQMADNGVELFMLFFVMSPAIQAGVDWAQLFYFDLKRLEHAPLGPLLAQYRRYVARLAWLMGVASWALGSVAGTVVYLRSLGALYGLLLPFFMARALAASAQIQAFCARQYGTLLATGSLWLVVFVLVARVSSEEWKLAIVTLATVAVAAALKVVKPEGAVAGERFVGVVEWLHLLSAVEGPVRVGSATIRPAVRRKPRGRHASRRVGGGERLFARRLATRLPRGSAATMTPAGRLLWLEPANSRRIRAEAIAVLSGGLAGLVREAVEYPSGREALRGAWREHGLDAVFGHADPDNGGSLSLAELDARFARLFPDGRVFRPGTPSPDARALPSDWRRWILRDASRFLSRLEAPQTRSPVDVTALCLGGQLNRVFVTRRDSRHEARQRWRALVRRANLLAAMGAVVD
jgi:hypothetical protein